MPAQAPLRKYRIERYLAEGGMGAIYLGKKLGAGGFEKEVVLKQLLPEYTSRPEFRDLFFREAKISASLDHVNIVRTFDLVAADDALFIVMEYVRGADLRTIVWRARLRRRALSTEAVLHVGLEILAGLAYAHARRSADGAPLGIIHRDVSPSNILCSGQGDVKLSDFGIAKAATFSSVFYRVRGKVGYMSPEQAHNQQLDNRSDLFSLAVVIFETLIGERLFTGDLQTPPEVVYAQGIPRLSSKRPDLPVELEAVFDRALARRPEERFQDAAGFAHALRDVARRHGLIYSAPELAAELASILGADPERWTSDESAVGTETARLPLGGGLEGREAESLLLADPPAAGGRPSRSFEIPEVATPALAEPAPLDVPVEPGAASAFGLLEPPVFSDAPVGSAEFLAPAALRRRRWLVASAFVLGLGLAGAIVARVARETAAGGHPPAAERGPRP
jgi:serine/threonine-protein kinase